MKVCKILLGPIAGSDRNYEEGEEIILDNKTAELFDGWKFIEILRNVEAGKTAPTKPKPTVEVDI